MERNKYNIVINQTFILGKELGRGSFGTIYYGVNSTLDKNHEDYNVAIKLEHKDTKPNLLRSEGRYHTYLYKQGVAIPKIHWYGVKDDYNVIIMQLMGPSLETLMNLCGGKFSIGTVSLIAIEILNIMRYIHSRGLIHRDIKTEYFIIGLNNNKINIIDFGLCKLFKINQNEHIPYATNKKLIGTARYISISSHLGYEQSRRDDLESIGYLLVYLAKGKLPWQRITATPPTSKYQLIYEQKQKIPSRHLCKDLPDEFMTYLDYVKGLKFTEKPNYTHLIDLFKTVLEREPSNSLDWETKIAKS